MRSRKWTVLLVILAALTMAAPTWAKSLKATMTIDPAMVGATHLKGGRYQFVVNGTDLQIKDRESGRVVANVTGHLVQSKTKPESDEVVLVKNKIEEVHFANKTQYFKLKG